MDELINLSPIRIIVRMPEPDCFLRSCKALLRGILRRDNPTNWRPAAAATRSFKMVLLTAASEHLLSEVHALYREPFLFYLRSAFAFAKLKRTKRQMLLRKALYRSYNTAKKET